MSNNLDDDLLDDDLPVDIDADNTGSDDDGIPLWKWAAGAGGAIVGLYLLAWLFEVMIGVVGFLVYYGMIALLVYGAYRGVKYMLSDDTSSSASTPAVESDDQQVALPEDMDVESELDSELGELESGGADNLDDELTGVSLDDTELDSDLDEVSAEASAERELDDDELERKFAELEKEMDES